MLKRSTQVCSCRPGVGRLPRGTDIHGLGEFILSTMEGGVMQARTHRDIAYFDRSIAQLRHHMARLETSARQGAAA